MSAPRQKAVVGELAWHTMELYPDGAGAHGRLGGPTASVVFRRASSQHYEYTISDLPGARCPAAWTCPSNLTQIIPVPVLLPALGSADRSIDRPTDRAG